ncbi:MAG: peptidoglycan bridge formation glycyltransferase FemA/FemB family protein [Candidatus Nealsonbacteria bacterium]|nr:peptidoglycan bridge formation glycyltransferase FemA/FemB family protein [Candidatus Nealsonbacteria bacterium]
MEVKKIKDKKIWEDFLLKCKEKTFLQSWNWGEFQEKMENKIWRLGIYDNGELVSLILVSKIFAKRGTFILIQHGPNINEQGTKNREQILATLLDKLKKIAKKEKVSFIRMVSLWKRNEENEEIFKNLGFRPAPMHASAYEATLKLDLSPSEEELLKNMRKTTRYLIRQALKDAGLEILKSDRIEDVELYNKLNQEVAGYQQFVPFSLQFVKNEFNVLAKDNQALLFFGKYQEKIIASALVVFWSNIGFYHQAALSPKYHKIPIAYLLQWEAIKEAKKRGCILYDFWGYVNPKENAEHPWAGPTLFKMGFGGKPYEYVKTQDFPLSKKYWLTFIFEKLRKIKRGL